MNEIPEITEHLEVLRTVQEKTVIKIQNIEEQIRKVPKEPDFTTAVKIAMRYLNVRLRIISIEQDSIGEKPPSTILEEESDRIMLIIKTASDG